MFCDAVWFDYRGRAVEGPMIRYMGQCITYNGRLERFLRDFAVLFGITLSTEEGTVNPRCLVAFHSILYDQDVALEPLM